MSWSEKYKKSIDCSNPKGFIQKAHCQGRKNRNENNMKLSEFREAVRKIIEAKRGRGIKTIQSDIEKNNADIKKALDFYIKNKETDKAKAFIEVLKKLNKKKQELSQEFDDKISGMYRNAEFQGPAPFKRR